MTFTRTADVHGIAKKTTVGKYTTEWITRDRVIIINGCDLSPNHFFNKLYLAVDAAAAGD